MIALRRRGVQLNALAWLILLLLLVTSTARAQDPPPDAQVIDGVQLRLRVAPSLDAAMLRLLDPLTPLTIRSLSPDGEWFQVETGGSLGWVFGAYVDVFIDLSAAFPAGTSTLRLPAPVIDHIRQVYAVGQALGNRDGVFAKVGDSITVSILTLNPIGDGIYNLGDYAYLQPVIDHYTRAPTRDGHNAFNETPLAAKIGWTTYRVLNPEEGDPDVCLPGESPLICTYRVLRPSVALIMFGTNDVGILFAEHFRANLDNIVTLTEARGIIPILTTIPPREGFEDRVREFNAIIADVAREHSIPLCDYGSAMFALGMDGLDLDGVHPSVPPKGYEGAADFRQHNLGYGYVVRNLTALQTLDAVWRGTRGTAS